MSSYTRAARNWSSREGAQELALLIEGYWRAKGKQITTEVLSVASLGESSALGSQIMFCVRSNMQNGMPPTENTGIKLKAKGK
jgi:hypothetical protein